MQCAHFKTIPNQRHTNGKSFADRFKILSQTFSNEGWNKYVLKNVKENVSWHCLSLYADIVWFLPLFSPKL